jgi:hypothetical protein
VSTPDEPPVEDPNPQPVEEPEEPAPDPDPTPEPPATCPPFPADPLITCELEPGHSVRMIHRRNLGPDQPYYEWE